MTDFQSFHKGFRDVRSLLWRYRTFVLILVCLFAVAVSGKYVQGDILGGGGSSSSAPAYDSYQESLRTCNSQGTMFEVTENLGEVRGMYLEAMSSVFGERERILRNPSEWKCGVGREGEPEIPLLKSLAEKLPGWHYKVTVPFLIGSVAVPVTRPVTFASFASIVAELQREYECKLTEIQDRNIAEVSLNQDIEKPAQFCCIVLGGTGGCRQQEESSLCTTPLTDDPLCGEQCPVLLYVSDLATRMPALHDSLSEERQVSRIALERSLNTMRSFEINYATARQFLCYERASLDLKNEMSLLADAVSCMPKIWDAVTSIHDRKQ